MTARSRCGRRTALGAVAVAVAALTACASGRVTDHPPSSSRVAARQTPPVGTGAGAAAGTKPGGAAATEAAAARARCAETAGFALSLVAGLVGQATPIEAARHFVAGHTVAGVEAEPDAVWTAGPVVDDGVTVTTAGLSLHTVRLPNHTWAVDSGERCTSTDPDAATMRRLTTAARAAVRGNGDPHAKAVAVRTTTKASGVPIWIIQLRGRFVCGMCSHPPEAKAPTGTVFTIVLDAKTFALRSFSLTRTGEDLASRGTVVRLF